MDHYFDINLGISVYFVVCRIIIYFYNILNISILQNTFLRAMNFSIFYTYLLKYLARYMIVQQILQSHIRRPANSIIISYMR